MSVHRKLMNARIALQGRKLNKSGLTSSPGIRISSLATSCLPLWKSSTQRALRCCQLCA